MRKLQNYINGRMVPPGSGEYMPSYNPSTGEPWAEVPCSDERDVDLAVRSAKHAFQTWRSYPARERARVLHRISELITARSRELAQAESMDQGKPLALASAMDIPRAAENFRFFANHCELVEERSTRLEPHGALNYTERMPVGVAGLISPWNLPLYLLTWKIAPALAYGNTVVAKPSEITPVTAHMLGEILSQADLPPGVCNIVHGSGASAGAALVSHPDVPLISFTGGTQTGLAIKQMTATHFKKLSLELGGKNPALIFADCDFDKMIETTVRSSFLNQGEICLCTSRIYVERPLYDRFVSTFVEAARSLNVGDPLDPRSFMGPVVSAAHRDKILSAIAQARADGGTVLCGGGAPQGLRDELARGYFIAPTIIAGLEQSTACVRQEIFGPVVSIHPFDDEAEALALANDTTYGLAATVWTNHLKRAHRLASQLQVGTVWVNSWMARDLRVPFGGVKASGQGREGGKDSYEFFTDVKNICIQVEGT